MGGDIEDDSSGAGRIIGGEICARRRATIDGSVAHNGIREVLKRVRRGNGGPRTSATAARRPHGDAAWRAAETGAADLVKVETGEKETVGREEDGEKGETQVVQEEEKGNQKEEERETEATTVEML